MELNYHDVTKQFLNKFPEFAQYYGADMMAYLRLDHIQGMNKPITFDTKNGVVYGGLGNDQITQLQVVISNYTTYNETAVIFEFNNQVMTNAFLKDLIVWPKIESTLVKNVRTVKDVVGLSEKHNLDIELNAIAANIAGQFNTQFKHGYPLANINPTIGMIGGILKNTTITPFVTDGWLFAGFEMQADLPTASPKLDFIN